MALPYRLGRCLIKLIKIAYDLSLGFLVYFNKILRYAYENQLCCKLL
jgi:hypothetical protein